MTPAEITKALSRPREAARMKTEPKRSRHRGISLLEVLISIFILLVGLLGVGALIPIGRLEVGQADKFDRAGTLGRAAFREMKIRAMLRPDESSLIQTQPVPM